MSRSESGLAGRDRWDIEPVVSVHVIFPAFEFEGGSVDFEVTDAPIETEHSPSSVQTPAEPEFNYKRLKAGKRLKLTTGRVVFCPPFGCPQMAAKFCREYAYS